MRISSSVTSVSWIPSEAIPGTMKLPFTLGVSHYDDPLPDVIADLEALRAADRFRFANVLEAWIDVQDGRIVDAGYEGGGRIGSTTLRLGSRSLTFAAVPYPELHEPPQFGDGWVRFVQTAGGRTGAPMPRPVTRPPFVQIVAPTAWTTLALTIHADGRSEFEVLGASPFPRHWVYDADGRLAAKSGFIDYRSWASENFGERTPWGDHDEPALVSGVESALEHQLSLRIMRSGVKPGIRKLSPGETLTQQGEAGHELFLLLDGMLTVEVNGEPVAEVGPGAILGERAILEGGRRTSTLRARTPAKVAIAPETDIEPQVLADIAASHRREHELPRIVETGPAETPVP